MPIVGLVNLVTFVDVVVAPRPMRLSNPLLPLKQQHWRVAVEAGEGVVASWLT